MVNIYAQRQQEAKNELTKSRFQKVISWLIFPFAIALIVLGTLIVKAGNGCESASKKANEWSEENKQSAHEKLNNNNSEWKKEVRKERVDSDSVSITSSDDGEVVEIVA